MATGFPLLPRIRILSATRDKLRPPPPARELMPPNPVDGFPLDILVANLVAAFLLGMVTTLHQSSTLGATKSVMQQDPDRYDILETSY